MFCLLSNNVLTIIKHSAFYLLKSTKHINYRLIYHSSQKGTKSHLKKTQSHITSQFPPEMILLKSQQNFQSHLKSNFRFTTISNICFKTYSRWLTGVKLTIGRLLLIGIYWYWSTNRRFIHSHLFMYLHKGCLTIGLMVKPPF